MSAIRIGNNTKTPHPNSFYSLLISWLSWQSKLYVQVFDSEFSAEVIVVPLNERLVNLAKPRGIGPIPPVVVFIRCRSSHFVDFHWHCENSLLSNRSFRWIVDYLNIMELFLTSIGLYRIEFVQTMLRKRVLRQLGVFFSRRELSDLCVIMRKYDFTISGPAAMAIMRSGHWISHTLDS